MTALHAKYCTDGYAASSDGWVTKFWGIKGANTLFTINNVATTEVLSSTKITNGQRLTAAIIRDAKTYADYYSYFTPRIVNTVAGGTFTLNLNGYMAVGEGPYYDEILSYVSTLKLQGQVISFCQNGSFGAKIGATVPIYAKSAKVCFIYKYDHKDKKLTYCGAGTVDLDAQTASFSISEGGDYVILLKSLEKTTTKVQRDNASDASAKTSKDTGSKTSADNSSASGNGSGSTSGGKTDKYVTVTIEIRCDTISSDTSKISNESIKKYIPSDGTIMAETKVKVKEGSTVYDVLNQQCRDKNIQLDAKYTPVYGSYYVEGINYIYEFDAGDLSGWEYRVNGYYPNYGSSEYKVKDGDKIVWAYTCDLGKDIGDNVND